MLVLVPWLGSLWRRAASPALHISFYQRWGRYSLRLLCKFSLAGAIDIDSNQIAKLDLFRSHKIGERKDKVALNSAFQMTRAVLQVRSLPQQVLL